MDQQPADEQQSKQNQTPSHSEQPYPVQFDVDYSEKLNRWSTLFRFILVIPIAFLVLTISGGISISGSEVVIGAGGLLFLGPLLMILFRKRYPKWWFEWNLEFTRFTQRYAVYFWCISDRYPNVDDHQNVHLDIPYPQPDDLVRGLPLVKWFLAIPHYIVLFVLGVIAIFVLLIGWISVIIIGRYPRPLFNYIVGYMRWFLRVYAYAFMLVTDRYPPFRFRA